MLDPRMLREQAEKVAKHLKTRGFAFDANVFMDLEDERKALQIATQTLQNERNQRSKEIGIAKARQEDIASLREDVTRIGVALEAKKAALDEVLKGIEEISLRLPNIPHESVPVGRDEKDNVEIRRVGIVPSFDFIVKSHDELGEALSQMDFAVAAKITGSRFVVLKSGLARLHRALTQFMMNVLTKRAPFPRVSFMEQQ